MTLETESHGSRMCCIPHTQWGDVFQRESGWWDSSWLMPSVSWVQKGDQCSNIHKDLGLAVNQSTLLSFRENVIRREAKRVKWKELHSLRRDYKQEASPRNPCLEGSLFFSGEAEPTICLLTSLASPPALLPGSSAFPTSTHLHPLCHVKTFIFPLL